MSVQKGAFNKSTASFMLSARNPVVFFANGIGDNLFCLPALRALHLLFDERLLLVCSPGMYKTFFIEMRFKRIVEWGVPATEDEFQESDATLLKQAIGECDLLISLNGWPSFEAELLLSLLSPVMSMGFSNNFNIALPIDYNSHQIDLIFRIPQILSPSLTVEQFSSPPYLLESASDIRANIYNMWGTKTKICIVHPETETEKMWNPESFCECLRLLLEKYPDFVFVIIGKRDVLRFHHERAITVCGSTLQRAISVVAQGDIFIGVDSLMLHVADFFAIPGIGLFATTDPVTYGFRFAKHRHVLSSSVEMKDLMISEVIMAIDQLCTEVFGKG